MRLILFEDRWVERLFPVTTGRPAFAVTCGSRRLLECADRTGQPLGAVVRPHLREMVRADYPRVETLAGPVAGPCVLLNARLVPSPRLDRLLAGLLAEPRACRLLYQDQLALACVPDARQITWSPDAVPGLEGLPVEEGELPLLDYPHDLIRWNSEIFAASLERRLSQGSYQQLQDGLFLAEDVQLHETVVSDTRSGPIVIERAARIGPFAFLQGPVHIGAGCRILEHAAIKQHVCLGHTTKIGGEVEASIVEPYTNKQHHGFLGHSYLGSWINLGAGTCNSDLKNTYGRVNMDYAGRKVETGMQFLGCIMGDYAKSAINTSIFTGKVIGVCSMMYGFVTENVPSFVNYARIFGQVTELPADVMIATQARMFQRRSVAQRDCDIQLIRDMFDLTRLERQWAGWFPHST
ncbi:MAG: glucose-1-phosphate thymidylyltransferase [Pirellulaceae bacterium]|nr:glucose-1-phosphate thymidylyltransferase [Pirellulaceae bacterium]